MEATAIDFRKLYLQEKAKRIKQKENSPLKRCDCTSSLSHGEATRIPGVLPVWIHGDFSDALPRLNASIFMKATTTTTTISSPADDVCYICSDPPRLYYWKNYLPSAICEKLVAWLDQLEMNHHHDRDCPVSALNRWTALPHANRHVAVLQAPFLESTPIYTIVQSISHLFDPRTPPNHVLVNDYSQATAGIMAHTDGPAYASCTANISIGLDEENHYADNDKSEQKQAGVIFSFTPRSTRQVSSPSPQTATRPCSIVLHGSGSLIVFQDEFYSNYLHGIASLGGVGGTGSLLHTKDKEITQEVTDDSCCNVLANTMVRRSSRRISLTIRHKFDRVHDDDCVKK